MPIFNRPFSTAVVWAVVSAFVPVGAPDAAAGQAGQAAPVQAVNRDEILAVHTKDEKGGVAADGRALFEQRCAICHRFGGIGKDVGPDLTTITSRFKKKDVIEAILWPSKVISDQYQVETFELTDGKFVSGSPVRETAAAVLVRTAENPDKPVVVPKAQIANRTLSTISLMPEGLFDDLASKQIADVLAFVMAPPPDK